ncbi:MAG: dienelactone hydrolase family protein [Dehalococcoidia bacterium]|nr:dienelactone hydrolase family protein [Dehalococcoidia bacterium]
MPEEIATATIDFKTNGERAPGYVAHPTGPGRHPSVVVIQEWYGVDAHIKDVAERFARLGFAVIAPDLYHGQVATEPDEARKLAMALQFDQAAKEIDAAASWLLAQPYARGPKFAIVGYCMGGGLALSTSMRNRNVGAAGVYYGGLPNPPERLQEVQAPVLAFYGSDERQRAEQLQRLLHQYQKQCELHIYEGAHHGFFNDTSAGYNRASAYDTWPRVVEFFKRNLA